MYQWLKHSNDKYMYYVCTNGKSMGIYVSSVSSAAAKSSFLPFGLLCGSRLCAWTLVRVAGRPVLQPHSHTHVVGRPVVQHAWRQDTHILWAVQWLNMPGGKIVNWLRPYDIRSHSPTNSSLLSYSGSTGVKIG